MSTETATATTTVNLIPGDARDLSYGIVLKSETEHEFRGGRIHNRHSGHVLQVWDNTVRPTEGGYISPDGTVTTTRYSYEWAPQATVIADHPIERTPRGATLALGDVVALHVHGYEIGQFVCEAKSLHNPHMVPVV